MTFRRIGNDIRGVLQEWLDNPAARQVVLQRTWASAVGDKVSSHCRALSFEHGVLTVEVTDSSWAPQLRAMSAELIARVNAALGSDQVKRIEWTQSGPADTSGAAPRTGA